MVPGLEWQEVPAGPFRMGSDPAAAYPPDPDETPRRSVRLEPFRLARTPVTNAQYRAFARSTGAPAPPMDAPDDVPVAYVTLEDTLAFCAWAGVRLPTENEWEAAARGGDDRLWPWGDELPDAGRAVFARPIGSPEPVGSCPDGASAQGALDLAGNINERVADAPVVRGGSFLDGPDELRCSHRLPMHPGARDPYVGFRVAAGAGAARLRLDWIELPGGNHPVGRDPGVARRRSPPRRAAAARRRRAGLRAGADSGHRPAVLPLRERHGRRAPA